MAEIYLGQDPKSLAVEIIAKYTRAVDSDIVTLIRTTPEKCKALGISSVPCLLVTEGERTIKVCSPYAIFRHIAEATRFEKIFLGKNETENNQILSYFELTSNLSVEETSELLQNDLRLRMFLVGYNITAADIFVYAHVVKAVQALQEFEKVTQNNLFRWVDHIQHLPGISQFAEKNDLVVSFPNEDSKQPSKRELKKMAKKQAVLESKEDKKKGKEHKPKEHAKPKAEEAKAQVDVAKAQTEDAKEEEKKVEPEAAAAQTNKKEKKKQQNPPKNKGGKKPEEDDNVENISRLDIRVGKIVKVWRHPDSENIYCEEIDIGEDKPRQIGSGLQKYIPIERVENAMVIVLANLKPRKLAGFESNGMVLCGKTPDNSAIGFLVPPEGSKPGDLVTIKGYERKPLDVMPPKKKIFESVVGDLNVDENGVARYKTSEFITDLGVVVAEGIRNGTID